jgi:hypothetical protein
VKWYNALSVLGLVSFVVAGFLVNVIVGCVILGLSLLLLEMRLDNALSAR